MVIFTLVFIYIKTTIIVILVNNSFKIDNTIYSTFFYNITYFEFIIYNYNLV